MQNPYNEKNIVKIFWKKNDLNKWRHMKCLYLWVVAININMSMLSKEQRFSVISVTKQTCLFKAKVDELLIKSICKCLGLKITQVTLRKNNKSGGLGLSPPTLHPKIM